MNAQHKKYLDEALTQIPETLHFEVAPYLRDCMKRCHAKSKDAVVNEIAEKAAVGVTVA